VVREELKGKQGGGVERTQRPLSGIAGMRSPGAETEVSLLKRADPLSSRAVNREMGEKSVAGGIISG